MSQDISTVIITGGTSGLGYETAKVLARSGWKVLITSRELASARTAANRLNAAVGKRTVQGGVLDLASQASVRRFAKEVQATVSGVRAVVCNAGISLTGPYQTTEDGVEKVFGVNHLGHFLLVNLLLESLIKPARIVFVSSGTHVPDHKLARRLGTPAPVYTSAQKLAYPADKSGGSAAQSLRYTTSKLCNVLCANELAKRVTQSGLSNPTTPIGVYSIDPGLMPGTGLMRGLPRALQLIATAVLSTARPFVAGIRTPQQSGKDVAKLVTDPRLISKTGTYYDGQKEVLASPLAYEEDRAKDLWDTSLALVGLKDALQTVNT